MSANILSPLSGEIINTVLPADLEGEDKQNNEKSGETACWFLSKPASTLTENWVALTAHAAVGVPFSRYAHRLEEMFC